MASNSFECCCRVLPHASVPEVLSEIINISESIRAGLRQSLWRCLRQLLVELTLLKMRLTH